jgi:ribosomal protein S27AE
MLGISGDAARQALARLRSRHAHEQNRELKKRDGMTKIGLDRWCPECHQPGVVLEPSTNRWTCSRCGVELEISPFSDGRLAIPFGGQEYALPSIIDHNLGSDPNRTIVELRYRTPVRILGRDQESEEGWPARETITEPYLAALGHTHWAQIRVKGEDDPMMRRALEILSRKLKTIDLPQPVYLWAARLGIDVRKCVNCLEGPEHLSKLADSVMQDGQAWMKEELAKRVRKMQSIPCLETVVDQVIRDALGGTIEKARTVDRI